MLFFHLYVLPELLITTQHVPMSEYEAGNTITVHHSTKAVLCLCLLTLDARRCLMLFFVNEAAFSKKFFIWLTLKKRFTGATSWIDGLQGDASKSSLTYISNI